MTAKQLKLLSAPSCPKADKLQYDKITKQIKSLKSGEFHLFFYEPLSRKVKAWLEQDKYSVREWMEKNEYGCEISW